MDEEPTGAELTDDEPTCEGVEPEAEAGRDQGRAPEAGSGPEAASGPDPEDAARLADYLVRAAQASVADERSRGAAIVSSARATSVACSVLVAALVVAAVVALPALDGWRAVAATPCLLLSLGLAVAALSTSLAPQMSDNDVWLGSPRGLQEGLARTLRATPGASMLEAASTLCDSVEVVFQSIRATNDAGLAALRTANSLLIATVGATIAEFLVFYVLGLAGL